MTVVVGYLAGKSGNAPLHLAVAAARTLQTSLTVATVVPRPWTTPSPARVDAEYAAWADQLAADSAKEAKCHLDALPDGVQAHLRRVHGPAAHGERDDPQPYPQTVGQRGDPAYQLHTLGGARKTAADTRQCSAARFPVATRGDRHRDRRGVQQPVGCRADHHLPEPAVGR